MCKKERETIDTVFQYDSRNSYNKFKPIPEEDNQYYPSSQMMSGQNGGI